MSIILKTGIPSPNENNSCHIINISINNRKNFYAHAHLDFEANKDGQIHIKVKIWEWFWTNRIKQQ